MIPWKCATSPRFALFQQVARAMLFHRFFIIFNFRKLTKSIISVYCCSNKRVQAEQTWRTAIWIPASPNTPDLVDKAASASFPSFFSPPRPLPSSSHLPSRRQLFLQPAVLRGLLKKFYRRTLCSPRGIGCWMTHWVTIRGRQYRAARKTFDMDFIGSRRAK